MRVFLTGASGFVGSYTVRALLAAGHTPRALVRDPAKAARVLTAIGADPAAVEFVEGDMLDPTTVAGALQGCDAAIHAAAAIGVTGAAGDLVEVNVTGTRNVVGGAVAAGLAPVVHVSTIAVFVPPAGPVITMGDTPNTSARRRLRAPRPPVITADGALARPRTGYGRSKVAAERYVRGLQEEGAPVCIVYPGGVCGPHQPTLDALMEGLAGALGTAWPTPRGGVSVIDVRDLAEALARAVAAPRQGERWLLGGHYLTWPAYADLCDELTGVKCRRLPAPAGLLLAAGSALDAVKRVRPFDYPLTRDAAEFMVRLVPTDDRPALDALGLTLRPVEETVADALRWLVEAGHLDARKAGRLADTKEQPMPSLVQRTLGPLFQRMAGSSWFPKVGPKVVPPLDRALHRLTGGRVLLGQSLVPSLVLTTVGAKSGEPREAPLACLPEAGGTWVVVGSNFGREKHPAWTGNLLKNPEATVSFRGRRTPVTARLLTGEERAEVWPRLLTVWPVYDRYVERSGRELRVFRLTPR
ncbi:nitroreductase family deazaflavin-dependent oxidoreductase [Actinomadura macrotermitis]|uniref:NAD-dependent epimerase/dehydratase domain-containing protein n=1 Tax=Actinomadura macrotermitis TaxID=2585200 RepID=A0A7K0C2U0_9ACTN|nr:nitroreductase family deazaflavin-dependent oxidoreductase [Actinomadura macrotermitis]MQY07769.1 hypothetical protein [Actinomadura macrotermitis]